MFVSLLSTYSYRYSLKESYVSHPESGFPIFMWLSFYNSGPSPPPPPPSTYGPHTVGLRNNRTYTQSSTPVESTMHSIRSIVSLQWSYCRWHCNATCTTHDATLPRLPRDVITRTIQEAQSTCEICREALPFVSMSEYSPKRAEPLRSPAPHRATGPKTNGETGRGKGEDEGRERDTMPPPGAN